VTYYILVSLIFRRKAPWRWCKWRWNI